MPEKKMFCAHCGAENTTDSKFCRQCGKALRQVETVVKSTKKTKGTARQNIWAWWPLLLIVVGLFLYFQFGQDDIDIEGWSVALIYVGLLVAIYKVLATSWRKLRRRSNEPLIHSGSVPSSGRRQNVIAGIATFLFVLVLVIMGSVFVSAEITSEEVPDDMLPALLYAFFKPTDWILDGLQTVAQADFDGISISLGGLSCPSFQFPTSGQDCYVDSNGMSMCTAGLGGAPSPGDCWTDGGRNYCQDGNGNLIDMTSVCDAYPCTPLCKTLGIK